MNIFFFRSLFNWIHEIILDYVAWLNAITNKNFISDWQVELQDDVKTLTLLKTRLVKV
jgi:hypothetical protein